ncbi:MAG: hypothetical protein L0Y74_03130 [candidate division Zixibacteria bacterium]|nr:hypothetical protein [candidate division Zixibacteria bacterium]
MRKNFWLIVSVFVIGFFLISADSGFSAFMKWETLPNAPVSNSRMDDLFFVSPTTGWIISSYCDAGCFGDIWKTTDGGNSWTLQITVDHYLRSIGFFDSLTGFAGTVFADSTETLYGTTDGGANWTVVSNIPSPRPQGVCGISIVDDTVMYASGRFFGPPRVIKTTNRGASWSSQDLSSLMGSLVDCYFYAPDSGFVVGSTSPDYDTGHPRVLFTSNGGSSWNIRHTGSRTGELCWKLHFISPSIGYISLEKFSSGNTYYLKTTNGGINWNDQLFLNFPYDIQGIGFVDEKIGWLGGWGGDTYETNDSGASWHLAGFGQIVNRIRFVNDTLGYAVGETVYKYSPCPGAGDANASGNINLSDIIANVNYIFNKPGFPSCPAGNQLCWLTGLLCRGDWSGEGSSTLADVIQGVNYLFNKPGGPWNATASGTCCNEQ